MLNKNAVRISGAVPNDQSQCFINGKTFEIIDMEGLNKICDHG